MPTYEFACPSGHRFDRFYRKISDSVSVLPCPECGAEAIRQLSGGAGLIFKGSGFYITDYGKDGKKAQTPTKAEGKQEGGSKGEGSGGEGSRGEGGATGAKGEGGASGGKRDGSASKPSGSGPPASGGKSGE